MIFISFKLSKFILNNIINIKTTNIKNIKLLNIFY